jgi:hypothetical protein
MVFRIYVYILIFLISPYLQVQLKDTLICTLPRFMSTTVTPRTRGLVKDLLKVR